MAIAYIGHWIFYACCMKWCFIIACFYSTQYFILQIPEVFYFRSVRLVICNTAVYWPLCNFFKIKNQSNLNTLHAYFKLFCSLTCTLSCHVSFLHFQSSSSAKQPAVLQSNGITFFQPATTTTIIIVLVKV